MSADQRSERTTRLDAPFEHVTITYPYRWPGFTDGLHIANKRSGKGIVYEGSYAAALAAAIQEAFIANPEHEPKTAEEGSSE